MNPTKSHDGTAIANTQNCSSNTVGLVDAGTELIRRGLPVIPCNEKVPCNEYGHPASDWHRASATIDRLEKGLRARSPEIGLILGPKSGLIDIEVDGPEGERLFAELFEGCEVAVTPTYTSSRGRHRLFAWDDRLAEAGTAVVNYHGKGPESARGPKLEIRIGANDKGAQSIIPPSPGRDWVVSLDDCEPAPLPEVVIERILAAAKPNGRTAKTATASTNGHAKPGLDKWYSRPSRIEDGGSDTDDTLGQFDRNNNTDDTDDTDDKDDTDVHSLSYGYESDTVSVEDAIRFTIPTGPGHRDTQLLTFARYLKGMPQFANCDVDAIKPLVRLWHKKSLPYIGTKPFEFTWIAFRRAWIRVKYPIGEGPLALIVRDGLAKPLPEVASKYESPEIQKLIAVCCELQRRAGDKPFFLTCRDAAQYVGGDRGKFRLWNEFLNLLLTDGVLALHERGGWTKKGDSPNDKPKKATTYFYKGDTPEARACA